MNQLPLILLICLSFGQSIAQDRADSLWSVWNDESAIPSERLNSIHLFTTDYYLYSDPDSAVVLGQMQQELAISNNDTFRQLRAVRLQGLALKGNNKFKTALEKFNQAMMLAISISRNDEYANLIMDIGTVYRLRSEHRKALKQFQLGVQISDSLNLPIEKAYFYNHIGIIQKSVGDLSAAIDSYSKALSVAESENDDILARGCLANIGNIHFTLDDYESAISYYDRCLVYAEKSNNPRYLATVLNNMSNIHLLEGNYEQALTLVERSLGIKREIGNPTGVAVGLYNLGYIQMEIADSLKIEGALEASKGLGQKGYGNIESSLAFMDSIGMSEGRSELLGSMAKYWLQQEKLEQAKHFSELSLSEAIASNSLEYIRNSADLSYRVHKKLGNAVKALSHYELYISTKDSLLNEENQRAVLKQEFQYSYEKEALADSLEFVQKEAVKNLEIEKQQVNISRQRIALASAGAGLILILALAISIKRGKKKSDDLLLNILPEETAKELKQKGKAEARLIDDVTVVFTDFKGFTAMSEQLGPKELVEDLDLCFSEFDRIMEKHGIEKIKTIGDAYMAACGLPTANSDHASRMVRAAFEMRDFVETGKARKIAAGLPFFEVRIGIHTGPVVAGIVGVKKFQYDIWGDTVNTASRMESSGEVGKVNISQATYELLKDDTQFTFESRGKIEAKGKGEMEMYFVEHKS